MTQHDAGLARIRLLAPKRRWSHIGFSDVGFMRTRSLSLAHVQQAPPDKRLQPGNGVNVAGYLRTESGVGAAARGYIRALQELGMPLALCDLSHLQGNRATDQTVSHVDAVHPYDLNLVCADVELHFAIMAELGESFFRDRYNVGIWAWELPRFPQRWYDRFAYYDEIWVGTSFIANTLAPVSPLPVVRIPPVLTVDSPGSREAGRRALRIAADEFVFLLIFDFHSHLERKNPLALIDAFKAAFAPTDPVRLVLKCVNADTAGLGMLRARAGDYPVSILAGYWPAPQMRDLMAACDTYVSLHRAEGTGLTISDAMALGKPVIATGWSGNMDFMTVANSFPVQYELVEIRDNVGPYRAGEQWAEPSTAHAAELMRFVVRHRDEADARGEMARRHLEIHFSVPAVANLIASRLAAITTRRRLPQFQREMWAAYRDYRDLGARIRALVRAVLPGDAVVLVVSKGDQSLLELDGRRAEHFPQTETGEYAGYYPADSAEAIALLDRLSARGGTHLLFPGSAHWWLDHYAEFHQHLDARHRRVVDNTHCIVYDLRSGPGGHQSSGLGVKKGQVR
jgi:glycosyltransferase involved in cell wall biosynthesis